MRWTDTKGIEHPSTLILAGGELLIDGVREPLFYPVLAGIRERWGDDGPRVSVQTTGDIMTEQHVRDMIARGVSTIAVASIDDYHVGHAVRRRIACGQQAREARQCGRLVERGDDDGDRIAHWESRPGQRTRSSGRSQSASSGSITGSIPAAASRSMVCEKTASVPQSMPSNTPSTVRDRPSSQ